MSQWVQHKSGQGEKWQAVDSHKATWCVLSKVSNGSYNLPKSEYVECNPPEVWEDVTELCDVEPVCNDRVRVMYGRVNIMRHAQQFRFRKIKKDTHVLIVERRKS